MSYLTDYQALLFDVDNTLLNTKQVVPQNAKHAIRELENRGYYCAICTARGFLSARPILKEVFRPDMSHIIMGGSQIITSDGIVISEELLDEKTSKFIFELVEKHQGQVSYKTFDAYFCTDEIIAGFAKERADIHTRSIKELKNWAVNMITVYQLKPELIQALESIPNITIKIMTSNRGYQFLDVTPKGVTKKHALEMWSKHTGIPLEKIIGFGDSENDLEFLGAVGYSVAMGNAVEAIKKVSHKVIGDVDTNGLGIYLEDILKGKEL